MAIYLGRDVLARVTIAQMKAQFRRSVWKSLSTVHVSFDGSSTDVKVVSLPNPGACGGHRRWLLCPSCSGLTWVVGYVASLESWACKRCTGWKSPKRPKGSRAVLGDLGAMQG